MEIGIKIKRLREQKRLSQMELSTVLGISQTKLCHIESNVDKSIDFILMNKICHFFEVGFDYFLEGKDNLDFQSKIQKDAISGIDWYNNFPESIIGQINSLILDNKFKESQINELLTKIAELESKNK
ncbi:MAG: helix-turn-helix transcriptional regulator [Flavobacterium sp.]|nr:helix-turn-helix transcriptional regulator [Flavobacterium sp.]